MPTCNLEANQCAIMNFGTLRNDFQQCGILTSVDSDEPVHPPTCIKLIETQNDVQSEA